MSAKYEPLKTVVALFSDQYDKSEGDQDKHWLLAWRGLEKMHYNISAEPKTVKLTVSANQTAYFPEDYVSWVKIGILSQNGELSTLKVNRALTKYADNSAQRLSVLTADVTNGLGNSSSTPYLNFYNNGSYQTLFGVGNTGVVTYGDCNVDEANNIIILSPNFLYKEIVFEYISSPSKDVDYKVDVRLREALIAFIAWKCKLDTRQNFFAELVEARRCIKPLNLQSFNQTIRLNEKMTLAL